MSTQHFVYDERHHLTAFEMRFPDGEVKKAFLMTSLSEFIDRSYYAHHLARWGLRSGIDYTVTSVRNLPPGLLGEYHDDGRRGSRRTVVAFSGVLQLVLMGQSDFGRKLRYWMVDVVLPAIIRDGYVPAEDEQGVVIELRQRFSSSEG